METQQNTNVQNNQQQKGGFLSDTLDYVKENPVTAVAGVALVAGATLLISKKLNSKPEATITEIGSSMASAVSGGSRKAAKYALMMRH